MGLIEFENERSLIPLLSIMCYFSGFEELMDRNSDIIFLSISRFDNPISFVGFSLAKELAKHNRVFFIEHPFSYKDAYEMRSLETVKARKDIWAGKAGRIREDATLPEKMVYVVPPKMYPVNFLPAGRIYDTLSKWNDERLHDVIRELVKEYRIHSYLFVNCFNPFYLSEFPDDIMPSMQIYYCVDDISQVEYTRKHGFRRETELIRKANVCLVTGLELVRMKSQLNPATYYLPNSCDYGLFSQASADQFERPVELKGFEGKKIIGFTGSIEYRTNFLLVRKLLEKHPDKIFVFIGPIYSEQVRELGIDAMPNAVFLGSRHITELPPFLQYMDVLIIPYQLSVLTKSIYPLKLNEYLAAGKPVVSTKFSDDIKAFADVVYLASDDEEFAELIDVALGSNTSEKRDKRMQRARENTWEVRVQQFWNYLDDAASTYMKGGT